MSDIDLDSDTSFIEENFSDDELNEDELNEDELDSIDDVCTDRDRDQLGVFAEFQGRLTELLGVCEGVRHD